MDAAAVRLKQEEIGGVDITVNLSFTDTGEQWHTIISNRTMHTIAGNADDATASASLDRNVLIEILLAQTTAHDAIESGRVSADGDEAAIARLFEHLDIFMSMFPIVEP